MPTERETDLWLRNRKNASMQMNIAVNILSNGARSRAVLEREGGDIVVLSRGWKWNSITI